MVRTGRIVRAAAVPLAAAALVTAGGGGHSIGTNLSDVVWILLWMALSSLPFGVIGAATGAGATGTKVVSALRHPAA